jgi:ribose transport system ATP-binding protein
LIDRLQDRRKCSTMVATSSLLELRSISKFFPGVRALADVSLSLSRGEILAIVGENGAGKSTLLKILGGILQPDQGEIMVDGAPRQLRSVRDADRLGIRLIHQELNLAGDLSVAENVFLGRQPSRGPRWLPLTNPRTMQQECRKLLNIVGLKISPRTRLSRLSIGQRQLVEIAKALSADARILVFDEPTSSLSLEETNRLLALVERLRDQGVAIIYVTHRLGEVVRLADRAAVLRDGKHVGTLSRDELNHDRIVQLMVGRDVQQFYQRAPHTVREGQPALDVRELCVSAASDPLSFSIRPGEIVGFAGLVGAGRTELACSLFGIERSFGGEVFVEGRQVRIRSPIDALEAGIALVPEDRKTCGLLLQMPVGFNVALAALPRLGPAGWYNRRAEWRLACHYRDQLAIRSADPRRLVNLLSGGNQQKVVLAKWLAMSPKVLILDEPTRGVDVGAKSEIYRLVCELAAGGMAVMMISSEMEEIVGVSDRVIVMREGRIAGELAGKAIDESNVLTLALGSEAEHRK